MERRTQDRRRGSRTYVEIPRRTVVIGLIVVGIVALVGVPTAALILSSGQVSGPSRIVDETPRGLTVWAVDPVEETLRSVTIVHPSEEAGSAATVVAGPLVPSEADVVSDEVFGGELQGLTYESGPGHDFTLAYGVYTIQPDGPGVPYGIDVVMRNAPYISPDEENPSRQVLSLGTVPQDLYAQMLVVVALPRDTQIEDNTPDASFTFMEPYRTARIGRWDVYFFDVTALSGGETIRFTYTPGDTSPPPLDYWQVVLKR